MNNIKTKQNSPDLIELLKAQRIAYSQCKNFQIFDVLGTIIALVFPALALFCPAYQNPITAFGVLWTAAYLLTEKYRNNKTAQGALIQEQFDTELYNLKWNEVLCKEKVSIDVVHELASKYTKNDVFDWYSKEIKDTIPQEIAIILCQRINFSWELTQRKKFVNFLKMLCGLYYLIYIVIGYKMNIGFYDILLALSPSIPFLSYCALNVSSLASHIDSKEKTLSLIDREIGAYKQSGALPTTESLRQIQDVIFSERTVPAKVPDWFYNLHKAKNENYVDKIILTIQKDF